MLFGLPVVLLQPLNAEVDKVFGFVAGDVDEKRLENRLDLCFEEEVIFVEVH